MKNIFENAQFGDKFRTRDGRKTIYLHKETGTESDYFVCALYENGFSYIHRNYTLEGKFNSFAG